MPPASTVGRAIYAYYSYVIFVLQEHGGMAGALRSSVVLTSTRPLIPIFTVLPAGHGQQGEYGRRATCRCCFTTAPFRPGRLAERSEFLFSQWPMNKFVQRPRCIENTGNRPLRLFDAAHTLRYILFDYSRHGGVAPLLPGIDSDDTAADD